MDALQRTFPSWGARIAATALLAGSLHATAAGAYTPATGSPERVAIYDALRAVGDNHARVFVVVSLKVENGWAWTLVKPQSRDGSQHFEPESALLHQAGGRWQVVDQPCGEGDCDPDKELARIRAAHPQAPADIFVP
jgi:hypothetical protein